jgi:hypothetical protein
MGNAASVTQELHTATVCRSELRRAEFPASGLKMYDKRGRGNFFKLQLFIFKFIRMYSPSLPLFTYTLCVLHISSASQSVEYTNIKDDIYSSI